MAIILLLLGSRYGIRFKFQGLGFQVQAGINCLQYQVTWDEGLRFKVWVSGFWVQGLDIIW